MENGTISHNTSQSWGGGVRAHRSGIFTMTGGTITQNTARSGGGGVSTGGPAGNAARFYMTDGIIEQNRVTGFGGADGASFGGGGGVLSDGMSVFTMTGGTITGNILPATIGMGGGVFINHGATFYMEEDALIYNNTEAPRGGGVFILGHSVFNMTGGEIRNNTAINGAGIFAEGGYFYMDGGVIRNNTATEDGGGIKLAGTGTLRLDTGTIRNNVANNGGAIFIEHNDGFIPSLIRIQEEMIFKNNYAREGRWVNNSTAEANPQVNPSQVTVFPHAFSNHDINVYDGHKVAIITFAVRNGIGGKLTGGGQTVYGSTIGKKVIEIGSPLNFAANPNNGFGIGGWYIDDGSRLMSLDNIYALADSHKEVIFLMDEVEEEVLYGNNYDDEYNRNVVNTGVGQTNTFIYILLMIISGAFIIICLAKLNKKQELEII